MGDSATLQTYNASAIEPYPVPPSLLLIRLAKGVMVHPLHYLHVGIQLSQYSSNHFLECT